jgi:hypothetical protein
MSLPVIVLSRGGHLAILDIVGDGQLDLLSWLERGKTYEELVYQRLSLYHWSDSQLDSLLTKVRAAGAPECVTEIAASTATRLLRLCPLLLWPNSLHTLSGSLDLFWDIIVSL